MGTFRLCTLHCKNEVLYITFINNVTFKYENIKFLYTISIQQPVFIIVEGIRYPDKQEGEHFSIRQTLILRRKRILAIRCYTRDVRNELLIVLYLDTYVGHDKKSTHTYLGLIKVYTTVYECIC